MEEVRPPKECQLFGHENVLHTGGRWKGNNRFLYHLYLILEDRGLKGSVSFAYSDSMQFDVQNGRSVLLGDASPIYVYEENIGVSAHFLRGRKL